MPKALRVVLDADALVAQAKVDDLHHSKVVVLIQQLQLHKADLIYPSSAIAEASTHIQRALDDTPQAFNLVNILIHSQAQVAEVNRSILNLALEFFSPKTSKQNTLFDCIVAAVAQKYRADAIFSFDRFYKRLGFKLVSDLKL